MAELNYKEEIEALSEEPDFEARGDALYLRHHDVHARMQWAFYRPSGSHPNQVSDPDAMVSIMAFNHSRLGAYERFTRLHPEVIADETLRVKIRNRARMLFRAMVDDDLRELVEVLGFAPIFLEVACDQMINGRIWNERYADLRAASMFASMVESRLDERLERGIIRRLQPLDPLSFDEAKGYLERLLALACDLHCLIRGHYVEAYSAWLDATSLHPLQRIALQKKIELLKES
jgi:hypothetical protein